MSRQRLTGEQLLTFVRQNPDGDRDQLALDAGYFQMRNGKASVERSEFLEAIAAAHGTPIGRTIPKQGCKGKKPTYKIKVSPKGIAPIGLSYIKQIGVKPGEFVNVIIEDDSIILEASIPNERDQTDEVPFEAA